MHWRRGSGMSLGLDDRLCVLLGDPTMWRNVVTLHACKRAWNGKKGVRKFNQ